MLVNEQKPPEPSLQATTAKGLAWTGAGQLIAQLLGLITTVILVRYLQPAEFGVVSMANIVVGLVGIINGFGLGAAIIQKTDLEEKHLNSVFVANCVMGVILLLLLIATSPAIAAFYDNPQVQPIVAALGITFLLGGASATQQVLLTKQMKYDLIAKIRLLGTLLQIMTSISLALSGLGSWALVTGQIAGSLVTSLGFWHFSKWRPRLQFDRGAFNELFGFGLNVLGAHVTGYAGANLDNLIVGRYLGAASLGYYDLAYRWASLPRQRFLGIVNQVMFPAFSIIQDDDVRLRSGYTRLLGHVSIVTFPLCIGLMLIAPQLVLLMYTEQWKPAIIPLQILCLGGLVSTIGSPMGLILKAKGRPDLEFKMTIVSILLLTTLLLMGLKFGLTGVALAVTVKSLVLIWVFGLKTNSLIDLKVTTYIAAFMPATVATLVMMIFVVFVQALLEKFIHLNDFAQIILSITVGASIYVGTIRLVSPAQWTEFVKLAVQMTPRFPFSNKILPLLEQMLT